MNSDDASLLTIFNETLYGNLFTYCCNNPVNRIDNSGNLSFYLSNYRVHQFIESSKCLFRIFGVIGVSAIVLGIIRNKIGAGVIMEEKHILVNNN